MKKNILLVAAAFAFSTGFAQDDATLKSKKGHVILPEAGDIAIGFDAVPMLNFGLNAVNIQVNTGQDANGLVDYQTGFNQVLVGKYYVDAATAYRAKLAINTSSVSSKTFGDNPLTPSSTDPENILLQTTKVSTSQYVFGGGLEMRRGHNRLQGFYGGELLIGLGGGSTKNTYEIKYDQTSQDSGYVSIGDSRVLSSKNGLSIGFGLRGFVGAEYFVAPKVSIAAEYGWGLALVTTPRGKAETESWTDPDGDGKGEAKTKETEGNSSGRSFGFMVDNGRGSNLAGGTAMLSLLVHF
jgi:hypothetical protein